MIRSLVFDSGGSFVRRSGLKPALRSRFVVCLTAWIQFNHTPGDDEMRGAAPPGKMERRKERARSLPAEPGRGSTYEGGSGASTCKKQLNHGCTRMDTDEEGFASEANFTWKVSEGGLFHPCSSVSIRG